MGTKAEREADSKTETSILHSLSGDRQWRDGQQRRQTIICFAAGETAPLQKPDVKLGKKNLLKAELLHKEILFFAISQKDLRS